MLNIVHTGPLTLLFNAETGLLVGSVEGVGFMTNPYGPARMVYVPPESTVEEIDGNSLENLSALPMPSLPVIVFSASCYISKPPTPVESPEIPEGLEKSDMGWVRAVKYASSIMHSLPMFSNPMGMMGTRTLGRYQTRELAIMAIQLEIGDLESKEVEE